MIYRNGWEIELSKHALEQAKEREIYPDMIVATLKTGRIERFGGGRMLFINEYKRGKIICVGEIKMPGKITIFTVEGDKYER